MITARKTRTLLAVATLGVVMVGGWILAPWSGMRRSGDLENLPWGAEGSYPGRAGDRQNRGHSNPAMESDGVPAGMVGESLEEQIRKRYGMVKRAGAWLPAYPLAGSAAAGSAPSTRFSPHAQEGSDYVVPLYITTGSLPAGSVGQPYSATIDAVGGVPPYRWAVVSGAPVSPITLGRDGGTLAGTPADAAVATFRVQVTDAAGAADVAEFNLRIDAGTEQARDQSDVEAGMEEQTGNAGSLRIITPSLPSLMVGTPYSCQVQATGGQPPYVWALADMSDLQAGIALDPSTGVLSGIMGSAKEPTPAPLLLTVMVTDAQRMTAQRAYSLQMVQGLTITGWPTEPIEAAKPWSFALQAEGGQPPYFWSSNGSLPPGLTLAADGTLSGTASRTGEFTVEITVADQNKQLAARPVTVTVKPSEDSRVTRLTAFVSLRRVALTWSNPADPRFSTIRIVRNPLQPPASADDGLVVFEGAGTSAVDAGLAPGTFHYAAFAFDGIGMTAEPASLAVTLRPDADPYADSVLEKQLLHPQAFNQVLLPGVVLGPPKGAGLTSGSLDVISLGAASVDDPGSTPYGGSIIVGFEDNLVVDGPGADFTVFENAFYYLNSQGLADPETRVMEPAIVSVSQDGVTWHSFPFDFSPRYDAKTGALNLKHPYVYNRGFAGVNPVISNGINVDATDPAVSGGDSFDLADLKVPGLDWIRFVRLQSTGHKWLADTNGDLVHHPNDKATRSADRNFNKSGCDLDAVTAIWMERTE